LLWLNKQEVTNLVFVFVLKSWINTAFCSFF